MTVNVIYLTRKEKRSHLNFLQEQLRAGTVDKEVILWLEEINKLTGVCTTQSCSGHKKGKYQDDGHIRLRLSKPMLDMFLEMLPAIYMHEAIEFVDVRYFPASKFTGSMHNGTSFCPEVKIDFLGLNRNLEYLDSFLLHLLSILRQCPVRLKRNNKGHS